MTSVTLNGEVRAIEPAATLADLVATLEVAPHLFATAVNGEFIPREARERLQLQGGDAVFTFQPITGG